MKTKKILIPVLFIIGIVINGFSQPPVKPTHTEGADTGAVNALLQLSKEKLATAPDSTISLAMQASDMAEKINFKKGKALALKNIGLGYYYQGKFIETLDYWTQSLMLYEDLKDETGISNLLNNLSAVYNDQGDDVRALDFALRSLSIAEKLGDKLRIMSALNSVGTIYYNQSEGTIKTNKEVNQDKALKYLSMALPLCEQLGNTEAFGIISENIGEIYFKKGNYNKAMEYYKKAVDVLKNNPNAPFALNGIGKIYRDKGDFDQALKFHNEALQLAQKLDVQQRVVESLEGLANAYEKKGDLNTALNYFVRAATLASDIKSNHNLKDLYSEMASTYEKAGDYKSAYLYQTLFGSIKDTLFNESTEKKLGVLQSEFDLQKKQNEIAILTKDKDLQAISIKRQKFAKNAFMIGLLLAFTIALLIYRNYLNKAKTHKILNQQKDEIEGLLLNILPKEVAKELQTTGRATPRQYESVSVMFTDFQAFTVIADHMSPDELVAELDACFIAFDGIIEKYQLEKIKTIGDSYMCAGGIPIGDDNHALNMVKAGLEIQQYVADHNSSRIQKGLRPWGARIGIHVGPVIAGVVGKKKYAYDIWGSTVNIASRMESNGEPGRVNISHAVFDLVKDHYACSYRGKVSAKNIGEIDMYFIEQKTNGKLNLSRTEELEVTQ
jgi:class 3 adenylate cyclase/lipopolysaccharide biosynthesis regulator YciM